MAVLRVGYHDAGNEGPEPRTQSGARCEIGNPENDHNDGKNENVPAARSDRRCNDAWRNKPRDNQDCDDSNERHRQGCGETLEIERLLARENRQKHHRGNHSNVLKHEDRECSAALRCECLSSFIEKTQRDNRAAERDQDA